MKNPNAPDLSHLGVRTQSISVLYVMGCNSDLLDLVTGYSEASGDGCELLDLESADTGLMGQNPQLDEIISRAKQAGFQTAVFTG